MDNAGGDTLAAVHPGYCKLAVSEARDSFRASSQYLESNQGIMGATLEHFINSDCLFLECVINRPSGVQSVWQRVRSRMERT